MGLSFQAPSLAVQTVLPTRDVPVGSALIFFSQLLGASVFVSVGESVLDNQLVQRLSGLPGFVPSLVTSGGATSLISSLPADLRETVLEAYNESLRTVFQIGLAVSCLTIFGVVALEWRSMLKKPEGSPGAETGAAGPDDGAKSDSTAAAAKGAGSRRDGEKVFGGCVMGCQLYGKLRFDGLVACWAPSRIYTSVCCPII